jgi:hypothetical protein
VPICRQSGVHLLGGPPVSGAQSQHENLESLHGGKIARIIYKTR